MEDGRWTVSTAKNTDTVELQTDSQPDLREKLRRLVTSTLNVCSLDTSKSAPSFLQSYAQQPVAHLPHTVLQVKAAARCKASEQNERGKVTGSEHVSFELLVTH